RRRNSAPGLLKATIGSRLDFPGNSKGSRWLMRPTIRPSGRFPRAVGAGSVSSSLRRMPLPSRSPPSKPGAPRCRTARLRVAKPEIDELMAQVARVRERGDSFEEQMVIAIQAMLVSPNFLFRIEKDRTPQRAGVEGYRLNDHELASRLSYFLWSSMPDEELL